MTQTQTLPTTIADQFADTEFNPLETEEVNEFVDYCLSFYGEDGLYPFSKNSSTGQVATRLLVEVALGDYLWELDEEEKDFEFDSLDRERVRAKMEGVARVGLENHRF